MKLDHSCRSHRLFLQKNNNNMILSWLLILQWFGTVSSAFVGVSPSYCNFHYNSQQSTTTTTTGSSHVLYQSAVVSTPSSSSFGNQELLLQGKLKVLEDVVKELHKREMEQAQQQSSRSLDEEQQYRNEIKILKEQSENQKIEETKLSQKLNQFNTQMISERQQHDEKINTLTKKFQTERQIMEETLTDMEQRLSILQKEHKQDIHEMEQSTTKKVASLQNRLLQYEEQLKEKDYEIQQLQKSLQKRNMDIENEVNKVRLQMQTDYEVELQSKEYEITALKDKLKQTKKEVLMQTDRLLEVETTYSEQVEIATAAVRSAEVREATAKKELQDVSARLTRSVTMYKLLWFSIEALSRIKETPSDPMKTDALLRGGNPGTRNRIVQALIELNQGE